MATFDYFAAEYDYFVIKTEKRLPDRDKSDIIPFSTANRRKKGDKPRRYAIYRKRQIKQCIEK